MYAQDNDGYFHEGFYGLPNCSFGPEGTNRWMHALKPYYKNQDLCLCPEAVRLEITFDRQAFCDSVTETGEVEITVIGSLTTSRYFYATDTIKIKPQR